MATIDSSFFEVHEDMINPGTFILRTNDAKVAGFDFLAPLVECFGKGFKIKSERTGTEATFEYFMNDLRLGAFIFRPLNIGTNISRVEVYYDRFRRGVVPR